MQRSPRDIEEEPLRTSGLAPGASSPYGYAETLISSVAHSPTVLQPTSATPPVRVTPRLPDAASIVLAMGVFAASIGAAIGYVLS